jgi:putative ABC transport system permease protein
MTKQLAGGRRIATAVSQVSGLSLDFKIGLRVLVKHRAVTLLAGLAMAFAIAICTATFEIVANVRKPTIPLEDGRRLVAVQLVDLAMGRAGTPSLREFVAWRGDLTSIQHLGAFRNTRRNLIVASGSIGPVSVAEMTASGFRVARVRPLLGRFLVDEDEEPGVPPVVVIGHDVWQERFHADPQVVGRTVRLGAEAATVIGVMPKGFAFPVHHSLWMPLRPPPSSGSPGTGSAAVIFGRLAPGASIESAQAELTTLWSRAPADISSDAGPRRPLVVSYPQAFLSLTATSAYSINLAAALFLALLCANVGLLLFVRAASREEELAVRSALGASRRRLVVQLVVEALVLAILATFAGLGGAAFGVKQGVRVYEVIDRQLPFWVSNSLAPRSIAYAFVLTGLCALISGAIPALQATASGLQERLREVGVGGTTMRLGRLWAATVVAQVALAVAFVPIFIRLGSDTRQIRTADLGVDASAYVVARMEFDDVDLTAVDTSASGSARFQAKYDALKERLRAEPGIASVAFASALPGAGAVIRRAEIGEGIQNHRQVRVSAITVDRDFFDAMGMTILTGRGWHSGDLQRKGGAVIVNQSFVREALGGRNAIGERIRFAQPKIVLTDMPVPNQTPEPWYEIVGVVSDVRINLDPESQSNAAVYHLVMPRLPSMNNLAAIPLDYLVIRVEGVASSTRSRLMSIAAGVDPSMRLQDVQSLNDLRRELLTQYSSMLQLASLAGGLAALLAVSGVYAVLSLIVARRTREIGIRLALGAGRWHIISAVFSKALLQVGRGVLAGAGMLWVFESLARTRLMEVPLLAASFALLLGAGIAACALPIWRALRIQPTEAILGGR